MEKHRRRKDMNSIKDNYCSSDSDSEPSPSTSKGLKENKDYNYGEKVEFPDDSDMVVYKCYKDATKKEEEVRSVEAARAWAANIPNISVLDNAKPKRKLGEWPAQAMHSAQQVKNRKLSGKAFPSASKIAKFSKNFEQKCERIQVIIMPEVKKDPPMNYWTETSVNVLVKDEEVLINYPYFGDQTDVDFEAELFKLYGHKDHKTTAMQKMSDVVFVNTIKLYEKLQKKQDGDHKNSSMNDIEHEEEMPPRSVFSAVAKCFPRLGFPFQLKERYEKLLKRAESADMEKVKQTTEATADNNSKSNVSTKDLRDFSWKKEFCSRCLVFCCVTHDEDDNVDIKYVMKRYFQITEGVPPVICKNADCINKPKTSERHSKRQASGRWTPSEIALCKSILTATNLTPCYISSAMTSKTCREIYDYFESNPEVKLPSTSQEKETIVERNGNLKTKNEKDVAFLKGEKYVGMEFEEAESLPRYKPCYHEGGCNSLNQCGCVLGVTHCDRWCMCPPDCPRRFKGCRCKATCSTMQCPCFVARRECDPLLCLSCGSEKEVLEIGRCQNVGILYGRGKPIDLKKSEVAGWGGFASCDLKKGEIVGEYCGEIISYDESARRALYYNKIKHTYLFSLNQDLVIDGTRIGSKVRFLNSSKRPNCFPQIMLVAGDNRIGIYAKQNIMKGEELFFDYEHVLKEANGDDESKRAIKSRSKSGKSNKKLKVKVKT